MKETKEIYPKDALRRLKALTGKRVEEIAEHAKVSIGTVNDALKGKRTVRVDKYAQIADVLGADLEIRLVLRDSDLVKDLLPTQGIAVETAAQ